MQDLTFDCDTNVIWYSCSSATVPTITSTQFDMVTVKMVNFRGRENHGAELILICLLSLSNVNSADLPLAKYEPRSAFISSGYRYTRNNALKGLQLTRKYKLHVKCPDQGLDALWPRRRSRNKHENFIAMFSKDNKSDGVDANESATFPTTNGSSETDDEDEIILSDAIFEELEQGGPPVAQVLQQLLGINIFTYILAGAIAIMLTLNFVLGPGWLGQIIGLEGTGTFTQVSDSLPSQVNLNAPENLL